MVERAVQLESTEEQIKAKAREVYLSLPVVRLAIIAKRSGATSEQVRKWSEDERWTDQRARIHSGKHAEVTKRVGSPRENMIRELELLKNIEEMAQHNILRSMELCKHYPKERRSAHELLQLTNLLSKIKEMRTQLYKELGIGVKTDI